MYRYVQYVGAYISSLAHSLLFLLKLHNSSFYLLIHSVEGGGEVEGSDTRGGEG